jgi:hypothetical protein
MTEGVVQFDDLSFLLAIVTTALHSFYLLLWTICWFGASASHVDDR